MKSSIADPSQEFGNRTDIDLMLGETRDDFAHLVIGADRNRALHANDVVAGDGFRDGLRRLHHATQVGGPVLAHRSSDRDK